MRTHYIYISYDKNGRSYIGCRTTPEGVTPTEDSYLGSFKDKDFKPISKLILGTYSTREEALQKEVELHNTLEVDCNPNFANRALQTTTGWIFKPDIKGNKNPAKRPEVRDKMSKSQKEKIALQKIEGTYQNPMHKPEAKEKLSKALKGRTITWGDKISKACKERLKLPYSNPSVLSKPHSKLIWIEADLLYNLYISIQHKASPTKLSKLHKKGFKKHSYITICKLFKEGWIPSIDKDWLSFRDENQK